MLKFPKAVLPSWRYWPAVPFAALVVIAGLAFFLPSPPPNQPVTHQQEQSAENGAPNDVPPWETIGFWEAFATIVIAGFAVLQYRESRRSSERQLRSYISVKVDEAGYDGAGRFSITVKIINAGQTPAYRCDNWTACGVHEYPLVTKLGGKKERTPHSVVIGPGLEKEVSLTREAAHTVTDAALMLAEKRALYVWGRVDYIDAFDEPRWTEFLLYTFKTSGSGLSMMHYRNGNEST